MSSIQSNDTSDLAIEADYKPKIKEIDKKIVNHDKHINNKKSNKLISWNFNWKIKTRKGINKCRSC